MPRESHSHHLLANGSKESDDDLQLPEKSRHGLRRRNQSAARSLGKSFVVVIVAAAICIASFWAGARVQMRKSALDHKCAAHTARWSPLLKDVSLQYRLQGFNGSFMDEDIYRQEGSPEVDEAWEALGVDYRAGVISHEDGLASGLEESFVQRADKYGGGFLVNVEGMHHLHCLNLVRKALYFNYDRYKKLGHHAFKNEERILRRHVTHCLDTVRQVLMCNVDTGMLGQVWVEPEQPTAFPDFNTKHVCKNYDDIRIWAERLQAPPVDKVPLDYLAPPRPGDVIASIP